MVGTHCRLSRPDCMLAAITNTLRIEIFGRLQFFLNYLNALYAVYSQEKVTLNTAAQQPTRNSHVFSLYNKSAKLSMNDW